MYDGNGPLLCFTKSWKLERSSPMFRLATPAASKYQAERALGRLSLTPTSMAITDEKPTSGQITSLAVSAGKAK